MSKTYGQIVEQVCKLYQRYGIKSVTMDDVARHLCISKKTLYEHFPDKEALVWEVMKLEQETWFGLMKEVTDKEMNAIDELFGVYLVLKRMFMSFNPSVEFDLRKYYPGLSMKLREIRRTMIYESVYRNLSNGKNEGLYRKELNPSIIARLHQLRVENIAGGDLFTTDELTSFTVFHEIFLYHLNGIMSSQGRRYFENNYRKLRAQLEPQAS